MLQQSKKKLLYNMIRCLEANWIFLVKRNSFFDMKKSKKHQVKSRFYYYFWGTCTACVVLGQLYVGTGYRYMAGSVNNLTYSFTEALR